MSCSTLAVPNATLSENSFYVGINLQNVLYGVQLGLYSKTMHVFLARRKQRWKRDALYAALGSVMLVLTTVRIASEGVYGQKIWLVDRNFPGGPLAFGKIDASHIYMDLGAAAIVTLQQMTDALMIYRCGILWENARATVIPSILWLANLALGILVSRSPAALWTNSFTSGISKSGVGLAYIVVSVSLNTILTCMIWYRLRFHGRTAKKCDGDEDVPPHVAIYALVVESALPYTLSGIAFVISYGIRSEIGTALSSVYTLMMGVSPQMLILRMAEGKAWQTEEMRVGQERSGSTLIETH